MAWQWHQLDHKQIICISLQTDNHTSTSPLSIYRPNALPAVQPIASKHWRHWLLDIIWRIWPVENVISVCRKKNPFLAIHVNVSGKTSVQRNIIYKQCIHKEHMQTTTPQPFYGFFRDHPGEPVPEENFWTLCCKGRLTEANTPTIRLGATLSRLTSAHLHHLPIFFTGRMHFLPPNQQRQSTERQQCTHGNQLATAQLRTLLLISTQTGESLSLGLHSRTLS